MKSYLHSIRTKPQSTSKFDLDGNDTHESQELESRRRLEEDADEQRRNQEDNGFFDSDAEGTNWSSDSDSAHSDHDQEGKHRRKKNRGPVHRNTTVGPEGAPSEPYDGSTHPKAPNRQTSIVIQGVADVSGFNKKLIWRFYQERWSKFASTPKQPQTAFTDGYKKHCMDSPVTLSVAVASAVLKNGHLDVSKYSNEAKASLKMPRVYDRALKPRAPRGKALRFQDPIVTSTLNGSNGEATGSDDTSLRNAKELRARQLQQAKAILLSAELDDTKEWTGDEFFVGGDYLLNFIYNGTSYSFPLTEAATCSEVYTSVRDRIGISVDAIRIFCEAERIPNNSHLLSTTPVQAIDTLEIFLEKEGGGGKKKKNVGNILNSLINQGRKKGNNLVGKARKAQANANRAITNGSRRANRAINHGMNQVSTIADSAEHALHQAVETCVNAPNKLVALCGVPTVPSEPSFKARGFTEFTVITSTTSGSGYAAFNPATCNDAVTASFSSAVGYLGNTVNAMNAAAVGTSTLKFTNLPFAVASLGTSALGARVVGYGIKCTNTTAPLYSQGIIQYLHDPGNETIGTYAYSDMAARAQTVRQPITPGLCFSFVIPASEADQLEYSESTALPFNSSGPAVIGGILLTGCSTTNPVTFLVELTTIVEYIGKLAENSATPNPLYPPGSLEHFQTMGALSNRLRFHKPHHHHDTIAKSIHSCLHGLRRTGHLAGKLVGVKTNKNESLAALGLMAL